MVFEDGALGRWLGDDSGALMMGLVPWEEEIQKRACFLSPLSTPWGRSKETVVCEPERGFSLRTWPCRHPDLELQPSELWEINVFFFKPPSLWDLIKTVRTKIGPNCFKALNMYLYVPFMRIKLKYSQFPKHAWSVSFSSSSVLLSLFYFRKPTYRFQCIWFLHLSRSKSHGSLLDFSFMPLA